MARPKGSPNRVTTDAQAKAKELGIDPFEVLLLFASDNWEALGYPSASFVKSFKDGSTQEVDRISPELRMAAARDATQYLLPKRQAVEFEIKELPDEVFDKEAERRVHLKILKGELKASDVG